MLVDFKTQDARVAMVIAVLFHVAVLLLFFLFLSFKIPDPPMGTAEVSLSLADFGMDNTGQGTTETETPSPQVEEVVDNEVSEQTQEETTTTEEVVTQEEAPVTKPSGAATKPTPKPPKEDPKPTVSNALSNALGNINSSGGGGGDGKDGKPGNVGNPDGHIEGKGVFSGNGFDGEMKGRSLVRGPNTSEKPKFEGVVVVKVYIDREGNVTKTIIDQKHPLHNTTNQSLWNLAKKQAKTAKFSAKANVANQQGIIIFRYKLK